MLGWPDGGETPPGGDDPGPLPKRSPCPSSPSVGAFEAHPIQTQFAGASHLDIQHRAQVLVRRQSLAELRVAELEARPGAECGAAVLDIGFQ